MRRQSRELAVALSPKDQCPRQPEDIGRLIETPRVQVSMSTLTNATLNPRVLLPGLVSPRLPFLS